MREANIKEAALGTKGRSGGQYDIWEAVFSPVGEDGYIKRIWDKITGVIDKDTAKYWSENYDLKVRLDSGIAGCLAMIECAKARSSINESANE